MPMWAPITYDQACMYLKIIDMHIKPTIGPALAEWNLNWLFDYKALSQIDGTVQGITKAFKDMNTKAQGAIFVDLEDNVYGIRDMAETLGPVEFIDTYMRKPYQHTSLYKMCGEDVFTGARVNAERLAQTMLGKIEAAGEVAAEVIHSAKVIAFLRR